MFFEYQNDANNEQLKTGVSQENVTKNDKINSESKRLYDNLKLSNFKLKNFELEINNGNLMMIYYNNKDPLRKSAITEL